jgi:hypothetical protein
LPVYHVYTPAPVKNPEAQGALCHVYTNKTRQICTDFCSAREKPRAARRIRKFFFAFRTFLDNYLPPAAGPPLIRGARLHGARACQVGVWRLRHGARVQQLCVRGLGMAPGPASCVRGDRGLPPGPGPEGKISFCQASVLPGASGKAGKLFLFHRALRCNPAGSAINPISSTVCVHLLARWVILVLSQTSVMPGSSGKAGKLFLFHRALCCAQAGSAIKPISSTVCAHLLARRVKAV